MVDEISGRLKMLAGVLLGDRWNITRDIISEIQYPGLGLVVENYLLSSADAIGETVVAATITFEQESVYTNVDGEIFEEDVYAFVKEQNKI